MKKLGITDLSTKRYLPKVMKAVKDDVKRMMTSNLAKKKIDKEPLAQAVAKVKEMD